MEKIDEILNNLLANYSDLDWVDSKQESNNIEIVNHKIFQAKQQIKEALLKEMPKEKEYLLGHMAHSVFDCADCGFKTGFNKFRFDCLAVIDKLFG